MLKKIDCMLYFLVFVEYRIFFGLVYKILALNYNSLCIDREDYHKI